MGTKELRRMERLNWLFGALLLAGSAFLADRAVILGVAVGALLSCLNFSGIRWLGVRILHSSGQQRRTLQLLLLGKMGIMLVAVFLAMTLLPISIPAFAVGLSVFLLSVAVESVRHALRPRDGANEEARDGRA